MSSKLSLIERNFLQAIRRSFICPSCRQKQAIPSVNGQSQIPRSYGTRHVRKASTTPSVTAVNARVTIPDRLQELHASLRGLEKDAAIYVETSQLQLARRGLESEDAVTRIAVLGVEGNSGARRLVRALLADPLAAEHAWEKRLLEASETDGKAVLLRYGAQFTYDDKHPLVRTFFIPSPILQNHGLELLVHTITANPGPTSESATSFLVPSLDIANSTTGRRTNVTYPVHKALIYEEGMNRLGTFASLETLDRSYGEGKMFKGVVDWSWSTSQQRNADEQLVVPINLALAEAAIDTFRTSLDKSMEYEHLWFDAGMPQVSAWLLDGAEEQPETVKPSIRRLVQTIRFNATRAIVDAESQSIEQEKAGMVPTMTRKIISQGIDTWAENAHTELRDRLDSAFHSKSWKKIKWWKLFWRVDDVGYITSDILQRAWLVDAEKVVVWLAGHINQSGLLGPPKLRPNRKPDPDDEGRTLGGEPPAPSDSDLVPQPSTFDEPAKFNAPYAQPWPQDISLARSALSSITIPPLQALAQALLIQTISTNILTSSLSALVYVSVSTTSPYEASAIAATGLVFSLRRLQKRWETARDEWESQVREEGKRVLRSTEGLMREAVEESGPVRDEVGMRDRAIAMEAVGKVQDALQELHK